LLDHQYYALERERVEYLLSVRLNELKCSMQGRADADYLFAPDPEVARIGVQLNQLRIKRRIHDYIVASI